MRLIMAASALATMFSALPLLGKTGTPLAPPEQYDHPFDGKLVIKRVDRSHVWPECSFDGQIDMRRDVAGCAILNLPEEGNCTVYLAKRTKRAPLEDILRHEIAHCNGWPPDHED